MKLGTAPLAAALIVFAQVSLPAFGQVKTPTSAPAPAPVKGDKEIDVPAAFLKKVPETVEDLRAMEKHVRELTKKLMPATVGIRMGASSGSGVIINAEGIVLTAGHVSGDPNKECQIILPDGRKLKGKTLGANRNIDSGMIQIVDKGPFPFIEMSTNKLTKGDWCLAIGHPGGFQPGRTPPLRVGRVLEVNANFLRTDCTLVGGDSGGPLFDVTGKVIGIHSRIGGPITANIHVPIATYRDTWDKLAAAEVWGKNFFGGGGPAPKGPNPAYLGALLTPDCKVDSVTEKSPAEAGGLKVGDVILKIDGKKVATSDEITSTLSTRLPDNEIVLDVLRGQEMMQIRVKLGRRPA